MPKTGIMVYLDPKLLERVNRVADDMGRNQRSPLIVCWIMDALDGLEVESDD